MGGCQKMGAILSLELLFVLCRVAHLDRVLSPVAWKGSLDRFPRAATLPHFDYHRILFRFPSNTFCLRPYRCGMHLGIYATIVRD
ncbi:hypothetical protein BDZ45DRAFT_261356 [Acephala macrosclerotiorum]|nr:hypothetical protein BDZ45DRAFT_261356 [Acephala macrosclerotiorum]